jgi:hypothetical protein
MSRKENVFVHFDRNPKGVECVKKGHRTYHGNRTWYKKMI